MILKELQGSFERLEQVIAEGPIVPVAGAAEIRTYLTSRYDFKDPLTLEAVTSDVERMLQTWQVQVTHPHYFGLFNPSVTLAGVVADTLVAMYNPQLANWRTSPAANEIERHTLGWLATRFGLSANASAMFTTGGSEANLSAVIVALTRAYPQYSEDGLRSLTGSPTIYLTQEAHHSFNKIAHMTGLGRRALRLVPTDRNLKIDLAALARCVAEDRRQGLAPLMVVGTGGTTAAGVIDPLPELGAYCRAAGLWFHVDAAWGGGAIVSPALAPYLVGIEAADSITCDAHKWLSVPMGSGMFFCRYPESVAQAFRAEVSYMPAKPVNSVDDPYQTFDPFTTSVQWSRRFIGLKLFMTLAERGEAGCAAMVEHQVQMGEVFRERLTATGWRIVNQTPFPLICFTRAGLDHSLFLGALRERQIAWMSEARVGSTPVLRACITSFKTTEADIAWVVNEMNSIVDQASFRSTNHPLETAAKR